MIYINYDKTEKIKDWSLNSIYVVADFDRTLTNGYSKSSWNLIPKSGLITEAYNEERKAMYEHYYPIEMSNDISYHEKCAMMNEWWNKCISLLVKYNVSEELIEQITSNPNFMKFRDGAKELLKWLSDNNIPVIIISAGIGNFVERFLIMNNCYYDNIHIISNFIEFKNGIAVGMIGDIIHSINKNEIYSSIKIKDIIKGRENPILLGNALGDCLMVPNEKREIAFKIGFYEEETNDNLDQFKECFDVVCTNNTSYNELIDKIKSYYNK